MKSLNLRPLLLVLALLLSLSFTTAATAQDRMASVDLRKVFDGYWKTKKANAAIKQRGDDMDKELKGLVSDFKKTQQEYEKLLESVNDPAVSDTERERRKKSAIDKRKDMEDAQATISQFRNQASTTIKEQQQRMRNNILEEVKAAVTSKAKQGNFNLVIDTAAMTPNNTPVFLYTDITNDLTTAVLDQLNATAPLDMENDTSTSEQ